MYSLTLCTPCDEAYGIVGMPLRVTCGLAGHGLLALRPQTSTSPSDASEKRMCTTTSIHVSVGYGFRPGNLDAPTPSGSSPAHLAIACRDAELQPLAVRRDGERRDAAFREVVQLGGMMQLPDQVARDAGARDVHGHVEVGVHPRRFACVVLRGETADGPGVGPDVGARDVEARRVAPFTRRRRDELELRRGMWTFERAERREAAPLPCA